MYFAICSIFTAVFTYMAIYKLSIDEFCDDDYALVAIHTSLEPYRLAYQINKNFPVFLQLKSKPITIKNENGTFFFDHYFWEDESQTERWDLVSNYSELDQPISDNGNSMIFSNVARAAYLLPETKKVDYLLKIFENENIDRVLSGISALDRITTSYIIEPGKIKSKSNLIF